MDSSAACLMRLARAVHEQHYKVVLTGEGADEALAGYAWFKTQKIRDALDWGPVSLALKGARNLALASIGGWAHQPELRGIHGARTAQQDVYDFMGHARTVLYSSTMWNQIAGYSPYDDLNLTNDRFNRWHPLNQSLYVGYKVMLAGLLLLGKGDRVAMNSSVETRYPLLDDDVIAFCASIAPEYKLHRLTDKWLLRQVAARTLPPRIANRRKTMFRASRFDAFVGDRRPRWVDQLLSPESLKATGWFDPDAVARERYAQSRFLRITPRRIIMDLSLTCVIATQLWHHIYLGGGLCELPTWDVRTKDEQEPPRSGPPVLDHRVVGAGVSFGSGCAEPVCSRSAHLPGDRHQGQPPRSAVDQVAPPAEPRHQKRSEVHPDREDQQARREQPGERGEQEARECSPGGFVPAGLPTYQRVQSREAEREDQESEPEPSDQVHDPWRPEPALTGKDPQRQRRPPPAPQARSGCGADLPGGSGFESKWHATKAAR